MIATKKLFPYQTFQGDHVLESSSSGEDDSDEDSDDVANNMFCMAVGVEQGVVDEQRRESALKEISKKVTSLDEATIAQLPPHYRWIVKAFAAVAVENPLVFETATNHELILDEFKNGGSSGGGGGGGGDGDDEDSVSKLGKFWKSGTYGEITCPAMDIIAVRARARVRVRTCVCVCVCVCVCMCACV